ncbi:hypothetical protein K505DRAFT_165734 [Melanomma pulvis-pyrius CBS 109.77]|uniref:Uncharacterized protein n=1 Tax=Melanomma pulvis-pyrius CBS 109.77 TaxID=1314802 RepID=A0A6A6XJ74_9PLEO|nr:hypothetical protein K505DRAFT_165734 [Melanomma pulvis-pyrius CBS 109.77]
MPAVRSTPQPPPHPWPRPAAPQRQSTDAGFANVILPSHELTCPSGGGDRSWISITSPSTDPPQRRHAASLRRPKLSLGPDDEHVERANIRILYHLYISLAPALAHALFLVSTPHMSDGLCNAQGRDSQSFIHSRDPLWTDMAVAFYSSFSCSYRPARPDNWNLSPRPKHANMSMHSK